MRQASGGNRWGLQLIGFLAASVFLYLIPTPAGSLLLAHASSPTGGDLLETLRAFDTAYRAGFTATGTDVMNASEETPVPATWKISMDGQRTAISSVASEVGSRPRRGDTVLVKQTLFFGPKFSAAIYANAFPEDKGKDPRKMADTSLGWLVLFFRPDDPSLTMHLKRIEWCMGRGFSDHIDRVESVEPRSSGLLFCKGSGSGLGGVPGTWELLIDVNAGYLVRSARFFREGKTSPEIEIKTTGTRIFDGRWVPESALWSTCFDGQTTANTPLVVQEASPQPDRHFMEEIERSFSGPYPGRGVLMDERIVPPITHRIKRGSSYAQTEEWQKDLDKQVAKISGGEPLKDSNPSGRAVASTRQEAPPAPEPRQGAASGNPREPRTAQVAAATILCLLVCAFVIYVYARRRSTKTRRGAERNG